MLEREIAERERSTKAAVRSLSQQLRELSRRVSALETSSPAGTPAPSAQGPAAGLATPAARALSIKPIAENPEPERASPVPSATTMLQLKQSLSLGRATPTYTLQDIPDVEVVSGRKGSYFRIVLLDPDNGQRFAFASASYDLGGREADFLRSLQSFHRQVLASLPPGASHNLYLQGYANSTKFKRPQSIAPGDEVLKALAYLPRQGTTARFAAVPTRRAVDGTFANSDLPLLRAAYVAEMIRQEFGTEMQLLQGEIKVDNDSAETRGVDLILYLE